MNTFETLNNINVNEHTEKKGGLTYLSWAWAWAEVCKAFPDANYKVYENQQGWNYFTDGKTCWVKTGVTIGEKEIIEYLPVMDFKNKSIPWENVTSFDVNKAIQRSLTKACARHGLGLYIYAGEDLPECDNIKVSPSKAKKIDLLRQMLEFYEKGMEGRILKKYEVESLEQMTEKDIAEVIEKLDGRKAKVKESKEAEELQAQFDKKEG